MTIEEDLTLHRARRQLEDMRYRYGKSRPAAATLLHQFDQILDIAEEAMAKKISEAEHDAEMRQEGRLQQAVKREDDARSLAETLREEVVRLRAILEDKRALREEREREGDDVKVSIDRGVGGWTVADIEEVAYRLRGGGAVDDTQVHLSTTRVVSHVPDPNVVTLGKHEVAVAEEPSPKTRLPSWTWREPLLYIGVPFAVFFVLATVFQWWA